MSGRSCLWKSQPEAIVPAQEHGMQTRIPNEFRFWSGLILAALGRKLMPEDRGQRTHLAQAAGSGINIHSFAPQKACESLTAFTSELHGQAAGGRNGSDNRNTCRERFLHHLE